MKKILYHGSEFVIEQPTYGKGSKSNDYGRGFYCTENQDFVAGTISLQKLSEAMRLGKLGEQIVLKSQRAFEKICYLGNEPVNAAEYYAKKVTRDRAAQQEYRKSKQTPAAIQEIYILDITREEIKHGDPRLS